MIYRSLISSTTLFIGLITFTPNALLAGPIAYLWTPTGGMQSLGTLGGNYSIAYGVNDSDQVVGISQNAAGDYRAFFWSATTGMLDIGGAAGGYGTAYAINNDGQVTGLLSSPSFPTAFLWSLSSGLQNLGPGAGRGINDLGQVVGSALVLPGQNTGFLWTSGSGMQSIPIDAVDEVNNLGQAVGTNGLHAVVWSAAGGVTTLPDLLGQSHGTSINDNGIVIGDSQTSSGNYHAVVWDAVGIHDLGTFGGSSSFAWGINNLNQVVGYSSTSYGTTRAFSWTASTGLVDFTGTALNIDTDAYSINSHGDVVGDFTVGPPIPPLPEPGAFWLCGAGLASILLLGRAKKLCQKWYRHSIVAGEVLP